MVALGGGRRYDEQANLPEGTATKTSGKLAAVILALVIGCLTLTGCGGLGQNMGLLLANIGWDENVAVSNLTKALLEDELGYESVEIRTSGSGGGRGTSFMRGCVRRIGPGHQGSGI